MLDESWRALREGVALHRRPAANVLRVRGDRALAAVEAALPRPLWLRDGQALSTLWLDEAARPLADVLVLVDDLDVVLLVDGLPAARVAEAIGALAASSGASIEVEVEAVAQFSVAGPFAWELLGEIVGPDVVGVPYLTSFNAPELGALAIRAGSTGEFGYELLVPQEAAQEAEVRLSAVGERFQAPWVDLELLDLAALENGFYSPRHGEVGRYDIATLQLLWRIGDAHRFPGAEGVRVARAAPAGRLCWVELASGATLPEPGAAVEIAGGGSAAWVHGRWSPAVGAVIGLAVLPIDRAWPGERVVVGGASGRVVAPPWLANRSLYVDAMRHSFHSRALDRFPPLRPGASP